MSHSSSVDRLPSVEGPGAPLLPAPLFASCKAESNCIELLQQLQRIRSCTGFNCGALNHLRGAGLLRTTTTVVRRSSRLEETQVAAAPLQSRLTIDLPNGPSAENVDLSTRLTRTGTGPACVCCEPSGVVTTV